MYIPLSEPAVILSFHSRVKQLEVQWADGGAATAREYSEENIIFDT